MKNEISASSRLPFFDDFILNLQANNYSQETLYNYERDLQVLELFLNENKINFSEFGKKWLLNFKAYLSSRDRKTSANDKSKIVLNPFSINRTLSSLRMYLRYLQDNDQATSIAPNQIKLVKTIKKHPHVPEMTQLIKVLEAPMVYEENKFVAVRNSAMLEILFATGMRISELINLRKTQLDGTGKIFIRGKGKKERFVYLTPRSLSVLAHYLQLRNLMTHEYLFVPLRGRNKNDKHMPISANYLQEKIKEYRELVHINVPLSAHTFRHGFATYLAESGANPAAIQILLGHSSLETTTRYVNASDRYAEESHRKFHPLSDVDNENKKIYDK